MSGKRLSVTLVSAVLLGTVYAPTTGTAQAELPAGQTVEYYIHETPADPTSPVVFAVRLELTSLESDGNWVGWEVTSVEFRRPGDPGQLDIVWTKDLPELETVDGLWWVEHVDPVVPTPSEFSMPPRMLGMAIAQGPRAEELEYDFEGGQYPVPPEGSPYGDPVALTYSFTENGDPQPTEEGEDEPVEVPNGYHDPD